MLTIAVSHPTFYASSHELGAAGPKGGTTRSHGGLQKVGCVAALAAMHEPSDFTSKYVLSKQGSNYLVTVKRLT